MRMPQSVMLGIFHDMSDRWAILGSLGWEEWSRFGHVDVTVGDSPDVTDDLKYKIPTTWASVPSINTIQSGVTDAGISHHSALSDGKHRSAMIPMGEMTRFGGGLEYRKRSDLTLGAAMDVM